MVVDMARCAKTLLPMLLLLLATVSPSWSVELGEPLPDFVVQAFDGSTVSREALEGKPVLLIFWNTWCPRCMEELPEINRLAEKFGPRGLAVLAINSAMNDTERKARAYWKKYGYGFPAAFDEDYEVGQAFGVRGVPTVFLVDSKGVVRYKHSLVPADMEERFKLLTGPKTHGGDASSGFHTNEENR
jgi:peroxiredoxin